MTGEPRTNSCSCISDAIPCCIGHVHYSKYATCELIFAAPESSGEDLCFIPLILLSWNSRYLHSTFISIHAYLEELRGPGDLVWDGSTISKVASLHLACLTTEH